MLFECLDFLLSLCLTNVKQACLLIFFPLWQTKICFLVKFVKFDKLTTFLKNYLRQWFWLLIRCRPTDVATFGSKIDKMFSRQTLLFCFSLNILINQNFVVTLASHWYIRKYLLVHDQRLVHVKKMAVGSKVNSWGLFK